MELPEIVFGLAIAALALHMFATHTLIEYLKSERRDIWEKLEKPTVLFGSFRSSSKFIGFVARGDMESRNADFASRLLFVRVSVVFVFLLMAIYVLLSVARELDAL